MPSSATQDTVPPVNSHLHWEVLDLLYWLASACGVFYSPAVLVESAARLEQTKEPVGFLSRTTSLLQLRRRSLKNPDRKSVDNGSVHLYCTLVLLYACTLVRLYIASMSTFRPCR